QLPRSLQNQTRAAAVSCTATLHSTAVVGSKYRHLRLGLQASLALAAVSGCLREVTLYERQGGGSSSTKPAADAGPAEPADAGSVLVLPQPDAAMLPGVTDDACGASVLSARSVVVEREVEVRT